MAPQQIAAAQRPSAQANADSWQTVGRKGRVYKKEDCEQSNQLRKNNNDSEQQLRRPLNQSKTWGEEGESRPAADYRKKSTSTEVRTGEFKCYINDLPDDAILELLARLPMAERTRLGATSKRMRSLDVWLIPEILKSLSFEWVNNQCKMTMQSHSGERRTVIITSTKSPWLSEYLVDLPVKQLRISLAAMSDQNIGETIARILSSVDCEDFHFTIDPYILQTDCCDMVFPHLLAIKSPSSSSVAVTYFHRKPSDEVHLSKITEHFRMLPQLNMFKYTSTDPRKSQEDEIAAADDTLLHVVSNCRLAKIEKQQYTAAGLRGIVEIIGNSPEEKGIVMIVSGRTEREFYGPERGVTEIRHDGILYRSKKLDGAIAQSMKICYSDDYKMMIVKTNEQGKIDAFVAKKLWGKGLPEEFVAA